ncbi:hypothetical protein FRC17_009255 [Serendipita sp. 399]|nr:hypothetical protein FRC17_009255 [Serendipita sp. 399]
MAYIPQANSCAYLRPAGNLYPVLLALSSLTLETIIFVATIYYAVRFQREIANVKGARSVGIVKRLYTHGIQYYMLVVLARLGCTLGLYVAPLGFQFLFPTIQFYLTSTMTSRLVLSLQREISDSQTATRGTKMMVTTKTQSDEQQQQQPPPHQEDETRASSFSSFFPMPRRSHQNPNPPPHHHHRQSRSRSRSHSQSIRELHQQYQQQQHRKSTGGMAVEAPLVFITMEKITHAT